MNKITKLLTLGIAGVATLFLTTSVFAQAPPNTGSQQWFCLQPVNKGHDADLSAYPQGTAGKGSPIPGFPVYVFVRINNKLTTGNPALDLDPKVLGSRANYDSLARKEPDGYGFGTYGAVGLTSQNPMLAADTNGLVPQTVDWHDEIHPEADHYWFGMQIVPPAGNGAESGDDLAQKFGTFDFTRAQGGSDCEWIAWDPFGYVFDAKTLGPIKGAILTLVRLNETTGLFEKVPEGTGVGSVATNPFITGDNGSYTFFSDVGKYKLVLSGSYNGIPLKNENSATNINQGYLDAGYVSPMYKKDDIIEEKMVNGVVEIVRSDIPVVSVNASSPQTQLPQLVGVNIDRVGEQISIKGQVTVLPAEITSVYKDPTTQETKEVPVPLTKDGKTGKPTRRFQYDGMQILDEQFAFSEITVKPGTTPLTDKGFFGIFTAVIQRIEDTLFSVRAQNVSSIKIDPMPSYLEGIAQDSIGNILPSALVGIYLQGSNVAVYQTKADINGHYIIGSQFIPPLPYEMRIKKVTGEVIKMSTTEYLRQNTDYHKANSINSFSTIKTTTSFDSTNTLMVTKTLVPQTGNQVNSGNSKTGKNGLLSNITGTQAKQVPGVGGIGAGTQGIIMVIVAILILVMIGVGAFVMMKSKQQPPAQMY